jgi:SAM-dependent methyltransferase
VLTLDVGCGSKPSGAVNVDCFRGGWNSQEGDQKQGEFMIPHSIPNFVIADAVFLPFKDECFEMVVSSHVIEHVKNPSRMVSELLRVTRLRVVVKCPHKCGSWAKRPFHVNFLDENWFKSAFAKLGYSANVFVSFFDYHHPVTSRLAWFCPRKFQFLFSQNILYRVVWQVEKDLLKIPFELEVHVSKGSIT